MVKPLGPADDTIILRFGGGVHSRPSPDEIQDRECSDGSNFILDLENRDLKPRPPFDLLFTAPNASEIRGFVNLKKTDGEVSFLAQSGDTVYSWDGLSGVSYVNTVSATAKLRGHRRANFLLDDVALVTDVAGQEVVLQWDGTTLSDVAFTDEVAAPFGTFKAKYCYVENERAVFGNITETAGSFPHLIVGSKRSDYTEITVSQRPSSSLSDEDPFYLLTPDLRPVNGLIEAFGVVTLSSADGQMYKLNGSNASDFELNPLFAESSAAGDEAVVYVGNDIHYGRQGRIESLVSTDQFGDVETDDITKQIADIVNTYPGWTGVYNSRLQRVYWFPEGQSEVWVMHKALLGSDLSPWAKWTTGHSLAFQPTAVMSMLDPEDGLEYVFMGDASGNVYRLEGSGLSGDAGQVPIKCERLSKLFIASADVEYYDFEGWVHYRKGDEITLNIDMEFQGVSSYTSRVTVPLEGLVYETVWGGFYWKKDYWGVAFKGRLARTTFDIPGQSDAAQIRVSIEGEESFQITEIGIRITGSSKG